MENIKKVLHLIDTAVLSGPGKTIVNSCKFIDTKRYDLHVAVFSVNSSNDYIDYLLKNIDNKVFVVREKYQYVPKIFSYFLIVYNIYRYLKDNEIDLIHTHSYKADFLGYIAAALNRTASVTTFHGFIENTKISKVYNKLSIWSSKKMNKVIAVAQSTKTKLIKEYKFSSDEIEVIRNAIVCEDYPITDKDKEIIEQFNLKKKHPIIGSIGRISIEKGQAILCKAFKIVLEKYPNACLLLIGEGNELNRLKEEYKDYSENFIFAGHQNKIREIISVIDLHVLPSYTEGLPNVILETECMGKTNVATEVGGTPECLIHEKTGLLVPPGDPDMMANAILRILDDESLKKLFEYESHQFIKENYTFEKRMIKMANLYDSIFIN